MFPQPSSPRKTFQPQLGLNRPFDQIEISESSQPKESEPRTLSDQLNQIQLTKSKMEMLQQFKANVQRIQCSEVNESQKYICQDHYHSTLEQLERQEEAQQRKSRTIQTEKVESRQQSLVYSSSQSGNHLSRSISPSKRYRSQLRSPTKSSSNESGHTSNSTKNDLIIEFKQILSSRRVRQLTEILQDLGYLQAQKNVQSQQINQILSQKYHQLRGTEKWSEIRQIIQQSDDEEDNDYCKPITRKQTRGIMKKNSFGSDSGERKKVTLVVPETVENLVYLREKWNNEVTETINYLCSGVRMTKYCYYKQKMENVQVFFSNDFRFIACRTTMNISESEQDFCLLRWLESKGSQLTLTCMNEFTGVSSGLKSKNFQRYVNCGYKLQEQQSLSLIFKGRTLDLIADSEEERKKFVKALKTIKLFTVAADKN